MKNDSVVVVGASLAGGRAAEALRRGGHEGRIVLVGADPHRPYDRPPLSKKYLRGQLPEEKLYLRAGDFYEAQRIDLLTGARAVGLSRALTRPKRPSWTVRLWDPGRHARVRGSVAGRKNLRGSCTTGSDPGRAGRPG